MQDKRLVGLWTAFAGRAGCAAVSLFSLTALTGCNIVGPAYMIVHGPERTPPVYALEKTRPTVVFVDDRASVLGRRALRQEIAVSAQNALLKEHVLTEVIDAAAAMTAAAHEPSGQPIDIASLGRAVQAEIVIYVTVDSFVLTPDGETFSPEAKFHIKVLDVTKPTPRLWPAEHEGYPLTVTNKETATVAPKGFSEQVAAMNALAAQSGLGIAQLFFTHDAMDQIGK